MHVLAANSVATLLNYLEEQLQHTPTPSQIQGTTEEVESAEEETAEGEGVEQKVSLRTDSTGQSGGLEAAKR